ncbi:MAG: hypothetical protein ACK5LS_03885 [Propioniciclava sp.]
MPTVVLALIAILVLALAIIAVVVMGMHGTGRKTVPDLTNVMARTARQLNGEGQPPRGLLLLFNEIDEVNPADLDPRQLPGKIRSSIVSARSAASPVPATEDTPARPKKRNGKQVPPPDPVVVAEPADPTTVAEVTDGAEVVEALSLPPAAGDEDPYGLDSEPPLDMEDPYGVVEESELDEDTVVRLDLPKIASRG